MTRNDELRAERDELREEIHNLRRERKELAATLPVDKEDDFLSRSLGRRHNLQINAVYLVLMALSGGGVWYSLESAIGLFVVFEPLLRSILGITIFMIAIGPGLPFLKISEAIRGNNVTYGLVALALGVIIAAGIFPK